MSVSNEHKRVWHAVGELNDAVELMLHEAHSATSITYITKITVSITTHASGKKVFIQDSNDVDSNINDIFATLVDQTAGAGVPDVVTYDFGDWGIPVTAGLDLVAVSESSGPDGWVYAEGWEDIGDGTI